METKIKYLTSLFACSMMVLLVSWFFHGAAQPMEGPGEVGTSLEVTEGVRVLENSVALNSLTIAEGASLVAPEGKSLTMTVFGIGTAIKPGYYKGDIFITVTDKFLSPQEGGMGGGPPPDFRAAILIEDGKYVPEKSVPAIVRGGKVTDKATTGVTIMGCEWGFNGIVVSGDSEYTIEGVNIDFEGEAGIGVYENDFIGYGSNIACYGNSKVTINNSEIKLKSPRRCAVHYGGNSVTTLNNCRIINESSPVTPRYVTWQPGFRGTNRATQLCQTATVYYNNCYVQSNGWGVLSIDGGTDVHMYVKDSTLELKGPRSQGYGAFVIGGAFVSYDNCTVNVQGYGILVGGHNSDTQNSEITNGTVINSTLCAVMVFRDAGSELKVNKGAILNSDLSTFIVKGAGYYLNIDDAVLNPGNGVILQLMDSDEPGMGADRYILPIGADVPIPGRDLTVAKPKEDVFMTVSNMVVNGDFYNSTTDLKANCIESSDCSNQGVKNLDLKFANAKVNGIISAASQSHREGVVTIEEINNLDMSRITQTAQEPVNNGVIVSFDRKSVWTVAGTSYLTSLTVANGAVIKAPAGKTLTMTVDGVETRIKAGTYKGKIMLTVTGF